MLILSSLLSTWESKHHGPNLGTKFRSFYLHGSFLSSRYNSKYAWCLRSRFVFSDKKTSWSTSHKLSLHPFLRLYVSAVLSPSFLWTCFPGLWKLWDLSVLVCMISSVELLQEVMFCAFELPTHRLGSTRLDFLPKSLC